MTVCIAAICCEGHVAVVASDTMVTNPMMSIEFEHLGSKITELSRTCVAMTSGDALAHTELFGMVRNELAELRDPNIFQIVDRIKECYKHVRHQEIRERILGPRGFEKLDDFYRVQNRLNPEIVFGIQAMIDRYDYGLQILVAGTTSNGAHLYGVSEPGTSQCYDAINFHAIGSGTPHALNSLIARECYASKSLEEAVVCVYEAKRLAEKAPGVGSVTDMEIVTNRGISRIARESIAALEPIYQKWIRHDEGWKSEIHQLLQREQPKENHGDASSNDQSE